MAGSGVSGESLLSVPPSELLGFMALSLILPGLHHFYIHLQKWSCICHIVAL